MQHPYAWNPEGFRGHAGPWAVSMKNKTTIGSEYNKIHIRSGFLLKKQNII
jgi:hypothetical protein